MYLTYFCEMLDFHLVSLYSFHMSLRHEADVLDINSFGQSQFVPDRANNRDIVIAYPNYPNPFRRCREGLKLSISDVCQATTLSRLYVIRTEQAVYPVPSNRILYYFTQITNGDSVWFLKEYREFQRRCRQANGPASNHPLLTENYYLYRDSNPIHPMRLWLDDGRVSLSVMQFCKAYCVAPSVVQRFLAEPFRVVTVPDPIVDSLAEAGYSARLILQLEKAYAEYRKSQYGQVA